MQPQRRQDQHQPVSNHDGLHALIWLALVLSIKMATLAIATCSN